MRSFCAFKVAINRQGAISAGVFFGGLETLDVRDALYGDEPTHDGSPDHPAEVFLVRQSVAELKARPNQPHSLFSPAGLSQRIAVRDGSIDHSRTRRPILRLTCPPGEGKVYRVVDDAAPLWDV